MNKKYLTKEAIRILDAAFPDEPQRWAGDDPAVLRAAEVLQEFTGLIFTELAAAELYIRSGSHASKAAYTAVKKAREDHFAELKEKP